MRAHYLFTRETENFFVYEANVGKDKEIQSVYLPKNYIARIHNCTPPTELDIIISTRKAHHCNCEYCERRFVEKCE